MVLGDTHLQKVMTPLILLFLRAKMRVKSNQNKSDLRS
jgi:hypothetical protein